MPIILERRDEFSGAILTFSNPTNGNCVEAQDLLVLADHLDELAKDKKLRVLVVTGAGENFCSGRIAQKALTTGAELRDDLNHILLVNERLGRFPVPVYAAVEGSALGYGCGFATQCDVTLAGEGATFALPEMSHGLPPLIVLSYFTKFVPLKQAFELSLTSRRFDADEAQRIGIVTRVTAKGAALAAALELAQFTATLNSRAVRELRGFFRRVAGLNDDSFAQYGLNDIAAILSERYDPK